MELPTYVALSRLAAQQRALDVTASNLANASTPGFKASRVLFTDWLSNQTGTEAPAGDRKLAYTQDRATYREQQSGALQNTSNPLDLAISGEGYFTVDTPRGPRLTRAGHFTQQANGTIGDMDGNALLSSTGSPLRIAPTDTEITVTRDGTISTESGEIGRVGIVYDSTKVTTPITSWDDLWREDLAGSREVGNVYYKRRSWPEVARAFGVICRYRALKVSFIHLQLGPS
ncbi:MAG: flagellar hook-basal body complex protein [Alphaproteobacteria bacterium]|nr:MAG: flagellar hook-basal body complex protein [Alphaproteobacteria bacterium]